MTKRASSLKITTIVVGLIATALGYEAHFNSAVKTVLFDNPWFAEICKLDKECPHSTMTMERFFISISVILLLGSIVSLILGFLLDINLIKILDRIYQCLGGLLLLVAGALMIVSAIKLDRYIVGNTSNYSDYSLSKTVVDLNGPFATKVMEMSKATNNFVWELRKEMRYPHKLAAGAIAIINGFIYFATAGVIKKSQS